MPIGGQNCLPIDSASSLQANLRSAQSRDRQLFLQISRQLWRSLWPELRGRRLTGIGIHLRAVELLERRNGDLLCILPAAERTGGEKIAVAVDFINGRCR